MPDNFKNGLTDEEANTLLFKDVQRISNLVKSKVTVDLYQYEFDALVSLAFNVEAAVGSGSTLLRKLNSKDYQGAANEFKNWRMAGGVVSPGLVKRRAQETEIFKNN
ncbi:MAG: lysozyme, partial [Flavobacteriales bacterium]